MFELINKWVQKWANTKTIKNHQVDLEKSQVEHLKNFFKLLK